MGTLVEWEDQFNHFEQLLRLRQMRHPEELPRLDEAIALEERIINAWIDQLIEDAAAVVGAMNESRESKE